MHRSAFISTMFFGGAFLATVLLFKTDPDDFIALDSLASRIVAPFQSLAPSEFFIALTTLGSATGISLLFVLVAFLLRTERMLVLRLLAALLVSGLSVIAGKLLIARIRPDGLPWLTQTHSYSFPSGHTASATVLYGFIIVLIYYRMKRGLVRIALLAGCVAVIGGIGMSRIVLAVHYGSDVLAGFFLGAASLSLLWVYPFTKKEYAYLKGRNR
jgi:undecaprenyl-diphosphatase